MGYFARHTKALHVLCVVPYQKYADVSIHSWSLELDQTQHLQPHVHDTQSGLGGRQSDVISAICMDWTGHTFCIVEGPVKGSIPHLFPWFLSTLVTSVFYYFLAFSSSFYKILYSCQTISLRHFFSTMDDKHNYQCACVCVFLTAYMTRACPQSGLYHCGCLTRAQLKVVIVHLTYSPIEVFSLLKNA